MKLKTIISNLLTNKLVLNIVSFLALFNVIGYLVIGNLNAVLYFVLFSILIRYFSKNMTIVLGVSLLIVNFLELKHNVLEGLKNNSNVKNTISNKEHKLNNKISKNNKHKPDKKTSQGLIMSSLEENNNDTSETNEEQQGFESGRRKNRGYDIDYATTIEDAYDELNNILGSDGIQRLTSDTQNLMKQQMQLAEAMKSMTPLVKSITPMVENLKGMMGQMDEGKEGLGSIMNIAKKLSINKNS